MTNYESGKLVAVVLGEHVGNVLQLIYEQTIKPNHVINDFEKGFLDEISTWEQVRFGVECLRSLVYKDIYKNRNCVE